MKRKRPNLLYIRRNLRFFKCQIKIKWQNAQCMFIIEILMSTKEKFFYTPYVNESISYRASVVTQLYI